MKNSFKITEAFAVYTGGNIWLFHGTLEDCNWFLTDDYGATLILNADPAADWDVSLYEDWQKEHLVSELTKKTREKFCKSLCDYLLKADDDHRGGITDDEIKAYRNWMREGF